MQYAEFVARDWIWYSYHCRHCGAEVTRPPHAGPRWTLCDLCEALPAESGGGGAGAAAPGGSYEWTCEGSCGRTFVQRPHRGPRKRVCKSCQCKRYRAGRSAGRARRERDASAARVRKQRYGSRGQLEFGRPFGPRGDRSATVRLEGRLVYRMGSWGGTWGYYAPDAPESWRDVGTLQECRNAVRDELRAAGLL